MDLSTYYLGLALKNPIIASSSPLTRELDGIKRLEDAGAAAVVLPSLFEEQIEREISRLDTSMEMGTSSYAESLSYFPEIDMTHNLPDEYLNKIVQAKQSVRIPIIASLNGTSPGGWTRFAKMIEAAGADAIELNIYDVNADHVLTSGQIEQTYVEEVGSVTREVKIPVAVKIGPFFTSIPRISTQFAEHGAAGLVLFNRFYQPDIDIENLEIIPSLTLSRSEELRLPLRWIAILFGRVGVDLAVTTGVHTYSDVIKSVMAGANVTMMASELLHNGIGRIETILNEIEHWMIEHEYLSIKQMRGSMSQIRVHDPGAFERANYIKVLDSYRYNPTALPH